jgi:lipopolysaccharide transport system ATP-binding protein
MFVRLAFSVIANIDAEMLIIDEALAVGDAFFQQKCMRFLREFRGRGTVLFVSHDTGAVMGLCERAIWLEHGRVRAEGSPKDLCEEYLSEIYQERSGVVMTQTRIGRSGRPLQSNSGSIVTVDDHARHSFGDGAAEITSVRLSRQDETPLISISGGEALELSIEFVALRTMVSPIAGFIVKDRLGQDIFGDNTFHSCQMQSTTLAEGQILVARFRFIVPFLKSGSYSITAAAASGTPENHVPHHWMHEALIFTVRSSSETGVLVRIPMQSIDLIIVTRERTPDQRSA